MSPPPETARRKERATAIGRAGDARAKSPRATAAMPEAPARDFAPLEGPIVTLALAEGSLFERRGRVVRETAYGEPVRAFVALSNRARALVSAGLVERAPSPSRDGLEVLDGFEALARYAGRVDGERSLPRQELALFSAITPARARRDARLTEALCTLSLLAWPIAFDVGGAIGALDDPDGALANVLGRELARDRRAYPKELVRLAVVHGSERSCALALSALSRTRDADAWLDVLIEGDPFFDATHLAQLERLAKDAPTRDAARIAREIARDLRPKRPKRR